MELKPCPFCGEEVEVKRSEGTYCVECDCGCSMGKFYKLEDIEKAWNERQQLQEEA